MGLHSNGISLALPASIRVGCKWIAKASTLAYYDTATTELCTLENANNYLNTNIYSYLETSGGQSSNLYSNVVHFFNARVN